MSVIARELSEVWDALRARNVHRDDALAEVRIKKLRGIWDLRFPFEYPVSVLAGPNGCGKSTVLFACACAYIVPDRNPRDFRPSNLFPNFTSRQEAVSSDAPQQSELEFHYLHHGDRVSMVWKRGKSWIRRFPRDSDRSQPERQVYLRTLANLTNPSEVRSVLQLGRKHVETQALSAELLLFAHRILPWKYSNLNLISGRASDLLFAEIEGTARTRYSEFHMSSGERSILRISKDISTLESALVLIDEIDTGLHPYTQQQTMLELQRSALRQDLQIIVASHSPIVLDCVPPEARIFLDRDDETGQVRRAPLYRNIFQRALYGQSREQLSVLCEDDVAEGVIRGILDVLNVEMGLHHGDIFIGRNTGRDEFAGHIRTLAKFNKLADFVFVLDGDSRNMESNLKAVAQQYGYSLQPVFLPGDGPPEHWLWDSLRRRTDEYASILGVTASDLARSMDNVERLLDGSVGRADAAKAAVRAVSDEFSRTAPELARHIGRHEAQENGIPELMAELRDRIERWRRP